MVSPKDIAAIAKAMKASGIRHFKMGDLEMSLDLPSAPIKERVAVPLDAPAPESLPIETKNEDLTSLLKLGDVELLDQLFPDTQPEEESA